MFTGALSQPFWSKCTNILQRTWFEHELLLQLREENIKVFLLGRMNYNKFLASSLKYTGTT